MLEHDGRISDDKISRTLSMLAAQLQTPRTAYARHCHEIGEIFEPSQRVKHGEREPVTDNNRKNDSDQNGNREFHGASHLQRRSADATRHEEYRPMQRSKKVDTSSIMIPEEIVRVMAAAMAAAPTDA